VESPPAARDLALAQVAIAIPIVHAKFVAGVLVHFREGHVTVPVEVRVTNVATRLMTGVSGHGITLRIGHRIGLRIGGRMGLRINGRIGLAGDRVVERTQGDAEYQRDVDAHGGGLLAGEV
jgi:hypothetical protein